MKNTHKHLSNETYKAKINLEKEYKKCGHKVRLDIIITYLLTVLSLCGCLCFNHAIEKEAPKAATTLNPFTTTTLEKKYETIEVNKTKIVYEFKTINETYYDVKKVYYDLSVEQMHELKNLHPINPAGSPAYSGGFYECKEQTLDLLNIKKSKFSEAMGSNYNPFFI